MQDHGGNTSCVQVILGDGTEIILDAGTGIRELGLARDGSSNSVQMLLTHLHLDHIQGLLFFPPLFDPEARITVYGPPAPGPNLEQRLARYLSAPLSPVDLRELPAEVDFAASPHGAWEVGGARIEAAIVAHRGVTLGYRISEGDTSLCYLSDHEPGLGAALAEADFVWISAIGLAAGAGVLIHDCQYGDDGYPDYVGWGHSRLSDPVTFAALAEAERLVLFHHDPLHDDSELDEIGERAAEDWQRAGRDPGEVTMAAEGATLTV